jgi:hypothetical protein
MPPRLAQSPHRLPGPVAPRPQEGLEAVSVPTTT